MNNRKGSKLHVIVLICVLQEEYLQCCLYYNCLETSKKIFCFLKFSGDLFIIVFSMDCKETFEEAIRLREQILETKVTACASSNSGGLTRKKNTLRVPMVFAGNKCDRDMK